MAEKLETIVESIQDLTVMELADLVSALSILDTVEQRW